MQKEIDELTKEMESLIEASYLPEVYADHVKAREHQDQIEKIEEEIENKSHLWLELQMQLEEEE